LLGVANGVFSIAAIGSMMRLASAGPDSREGMRMGLWGAAQAVAFGVGGMVGTGASDLAHVVFGSAGAAYATVFAFEAGLFVAAAWLAAGIDGAERSKEGGPRLAAASHPTRLGEAVGA
jgi:BCD family chlorophyll transporter-like MFS transporter